MKKRLGFDLILLGAPAAGKDTQARLLEKKFALKAVESGNYFRALAKNKTKIGQTLRREFAKGRPAPIALVKEFLQTTLKFRPKNADFMFVGNPRLKPEAEFLAKELGSRQEEFLVIFIKLPINEIWKRSARRMRDDQDLNHVQERINWHKKQVGKTVRYFQRLGKLEVVDGNQAINKVDKDLLSIIHDYKKRARIK